MVSGYVGTAMCLLLLGTVLDFAGLAAMTLMAGVCLWRAHYWWENA